jgi:peptide/nickel transport system permease protein
MPFYLSPLVALSIQAALGKSITNMMIALSWSGGHGTPGWLEPGFEYKRRAGIEAAKMLGVSRMRICISFRTARPIIVQATLQMGYAVITAAGLSFLGIGAQEPCPNGA